MKDETRTRRVELVLTPTEYEEIQAAAKSEGFQVGPFMRFAALKLARS